MEGANMIVVKNDGDSYENFLLVKLILNKNKIKIATEDKLNFIIKTKDFKISKTEVFANFIILCKDKQIQFEGGVKSGRVMYIGGKEFKGAYFQISNNGRYTRDGIRTKNSMFGDGFDAMDNLARDLGHPVHYLIKEK